MQLQRVKEGEEKTIKKWTKEELYINFIGTTSEAALKASWVQASWLSNLPGQLIVVFYHDLFCNGLLDFLDIHEASRLMLSTAT